jgi:hypothetical protein
VNSCSSPVSALRLSRSFSIGLFDLGRRFGFRDIDQLSSERYGLSVNHMNYFRPEEFAVDKRQYDKPAAMVPGLAKRIFKLLAVGVGQHAAINSPSMAALVGKPRNL